MPVDVSTAVDLKLNHHLSYAQIAAIQGVTPQAIHQKIKDLLPIPETKVWIDNRADILANIQLKLLSHLDNDRLQKAPAGSLVLAACQLYDKERLERGMSTANLAAIHADIAALRTQSKEHMVVDNSVHNAVDNYDVNDNNNIDT